MEVKDRPAPTMRQAARTHSAVHFSSRTGSISADEPTRGIRPARPSMRSHGQGRSGCIVQARTAFLTS